MKKLLFVFVGILLVQLSIVSSWTLYKTQKKAPLVSPTPVSVEKTVVKRIIDGDTFVITGVSSPKGTVRLIGVDTPEIGECFASQAAEFSSSLLLNKEVKVQYDINKMDQYGRALVYVFYKDYENTWQLINSELLRMGMGRYYNDSVNTIRSKDLLIAAYGAYSNKSGLWTQCATNKSIGCVIKGNIGRDGVRYYHLPSFKHYSQTVVTFEKGDMYFCSEKEAISAGWKKAVE